MSLVLALVLLTGWTTLCENIKAAKTEENLGPIWETRSVKQVH